MFRTAFLSTPFVMAICCFRLSLFASQTSSAAPTFDEEKTDAQATLQLWLTLEEAHERDTVRERILLLKKLKSDFGKPGNQTSQLVSTLLEAMGTTQQRQIHSRGKTLLRQSGIFTEKQWHQLLRPMKPDLEAARRGHSAEYRLAQWRRIIRKNEDAVLPFLLKSLSSTHSDDQRTLAFQTLRECKALPDNGIDTLTELLGDALLGGPSAEWLTDLGEKGRSVLKAALEHEKLPVVNDAAHGLFRADITSRQLALSALLKHLSSPDQSTRCEVLQHLAKLVDSDARTSAAIVVPELLTRLQNRQLNEQRQLVFEVIGRHGPEALPWLDRIVTILPEGQGWGRKFARSTLIPMGANAATPISAYLQSDRLQVRIAAAIALTQIPDDNRVIPALRGALDDSSITVRRLAFEELLSCGESAAREWPALCEFLLREEFPSEGRPVLFKEKVEWAMTELVPVHKSARPALVRMRDVSKAYREAASFLLSTIEPSQTNWNPGENLPPRIRLKWEHPYGSARAMAISPDDRVLAVADRKGDVVLVDMHTCRPARTITLGMLHLRSLCWSPDGKYLAVDDGTSTLAGELSLLEAGKFTLVGKLSARDYTFLDGGKLLAVNGGQSPGIYETANLNLVEPISETVTMAASPDGSLFVTSYGTADEYGVHLRVWDAKTRKTITTRRFHHPRQSRGKTAPGNEPTMTVVQIAVSPDNKEIWTGAAYDADRIWYRDTGRMRRSPFDGPIISPDNTLAGIRLKPIDRGTPTQSTYSHFREQGVGKFIEFTPDSRFLVTCLDRTLGTLRLSHRDGKSVFETLANQHPIQLVGVSRNGQFLVTACRKEREISFWSVSEMATRLKRREPSPRPKGGFGFGRR